MKIIEGTPKEILEYQELKNENVLFNLKGEVIPSATVATDESKRYAIKNENPLHFSKTKGEYVHISHMNASYIMNVLKNKMEDKSNRELLEKDREFACLVIYLADKIANKDIR